MIMEKEIQIKIDSYISKLKNNLNKLPEDEQLDVINEIKSHIFESVSYSDNSNKKLDEVLKSLGNPKDYANLITQEYISKLVKKGSFKEQIKVFMLSMKVPFILTSLVFLFIINLNQFILFKEYIKITSFSTVLYLNLLGLPAMFVLMIPIAILYSIPWSYYLMSKGYKDKSFVKSWKLWKIVLVVGFLSTFSSTLIGELIVPYANQHSVSVMKDILKLNSKDKEVIFMEERAIQELNFFDAKNKIENNIYSEEKYKKFDIFDLYLKISIYIFPLVISLFSVFIGILMTTELFNNKYLVFMSGIVLPMTLYLGMIKPENNFNYPIWEALKSNIILLSITLLIFLGIFLKKDKKDSLEN